MTPLTLFGVQRTFVSAETGSDSNNCSRTAPCRNFNAAILLTDAGGEVVALDSGGYGAMTIGQPIQIVAPPGVHAAITAFSGNAVTIDAPSSAVIVGGLTLIGAGATTGILVSNYGSLHIENVNVTGFTDRGLNVQAAGHVTLEASHFMRNGTGVSITSANATINNVLSEKNTGSGFATSSAKIVITNSRAVGNGGHGFSCAAGTMMLESSVAAHQTTFDRAGLIASAGCVARLSNCILINNYNAIQNYANGATIKTRGNNTIEDYTSLFVGNPPTSYATQ